MKTAGTSFAVCISLCALFSPVASGLDTDVYLKARTVDRDDAPQVMIIFDNSSSMAGAWVNSAAGYTPGTTYTYKGAGTAFHADKIYWKTSNQNEPTSHDTYPGQWFSISNNRCATTGLPWYGDTTGTVGAVNTTVVQSVSGGDWSSISTTNGTVECKADHDAGKADTQTNESGLKWVRKNSNGYTDQTGQKFGWGGTSVTLYSGNYLNYRSDSSTPVKETRLQAAARVVGEVIDANPGVHFGLMLFNKNLSTPHGGYVAMRIGPLTESVTYNSTSMSRAAAIKSIVNNIRLRPHPYSNIPSPPPDYVCDDSPTPADCTDTSLPVVGTPLAEAMWEAKRYFAGETPKYGYPSPSPAPAPDAAAKDSTSGKYISPFKYTCQQAYVILMTDGNPWQTDDTDANSDIASLPGIGSFDSGYTNGKSSRLDELAAWMYNQDLVDDSILQNNQRVITYTIGFALSTSTDDTAGKQLLEDTAISAGGKYTTADTASALATSINNALIEIQQTNSSFAAPSLSVNAFNKLFNRDEIYFALFKPSTTTRWDGNVKKFKLCPQTTSACTFGEIIDADGNPAIDSVTKRIKDSAKSYWSTSADGGDVSKGGAGGQLTSPNTRRLYTYQGAYTQTDTTLPTTGTRIEAVAGNTFYDGALANPLILGLPSTATTSDVNRLVKWMLGYDSYDEDADLDTAEARWGHGDPLHSRPSAITFGKDSATAEPIIKLFYAGNDGIVRIVNDFNGKEEWAFVPKEMLQYQWNMAQDAEGQHIYGVDGTPTFWIYDQDGDGIIEPATDHVYMYIGMRRSAGTNKNIYAFDITPASTLTNRANTSDLTPKLMFVIQGGTGDYLKLAQTWSRPAVTKIRYGCSANCTTVNDNNAKTVLIFGGGYDSINEDNAMPVKPASAANEKVGNAVYVADPKTGARLWWASNVPRRQTRLIHPHFSCRICASVSLRILP